MFDCNRLCDMFGYNRLCGVFQMLINFFVEQAERFRLKAQLSTLVGSKPQSRVCEPVFPLCRLGSCFFAGTRGISNSNRHLWQWKEEQCCAKYACTTLNLTSDEISQTIASQCEFGDGVHQLLIFQFLLNLKQQQNLMKMMFYCIHFPVWPYPPQIMIF